MNIKTLADLHDSDKLNQSNHKSNYKYKLGHRLGSSLNTKSGWLFINFFKNLSEFIFGYIFRYNNKICNNFLYVDQDVTIFKKQKQIKNRALLDTGNMNLTLVHDNLLYQLGYLEQDFDDQNLVQCVGIGNRLQELATIYLKYQIADYVFEKKVAILTEKIDKYDIIICQNDIADLIQYGYQLKI